MVKSTFHSFWSQIIDDQNLNYDYYTNSYVDLHGDMLAIPFCKMTHVNSLTKTKTTKLYEANIFQNCKTNINFEKTTKCPQIILEHIFNYLNNNGSPTFHLLDYINKPQNISLHDLTWILISSFEHRHFNLKNKRMIIFLKLIIFAITQVNYSFKYFIIKIITLWFNKYDQHFNNEYYSVKNLEKIYNRNSYNKLSFSNYCTRMENASKKLLSIDLRNTMVGYCELKGLTQVEYINFRKKIKNILKATELIRNDLDLIHIYKQYTFVNNSKDYLINILDKELVSFLKK